MAIYDYKTLALDTLAAIVGYSASIIPPPAPAGATFNVYTGLTEPEEKDGVWLKVDIDSLPVSVEVFLAQEEGGGTWDFSSSMPTGAMYTAGASVGTKVYVCGGRPSEVSSPFNTTRIYETTTGVWTTGNAMPSAISGHAGASVGTKVYMCGGGAVTNIYETTTGVWTTGNAMPVSSTGNAGASVGTKVYVCGGTYYKSGTKYTNTTRIYETTTGVWTTGTAMPGQACCALAGASVGTKVYMCGGGGTYGIFTLNTTRIYETTTGVWTTGNAMPSAIYGHAGASVGTKVYMCGGSVTYIYETITGVWTTGNAMPAPASGVTGASVGAKLYVIGNSNVIRTLHLPNYSYTDGTVVILTGQTAVGINERIVKLLSNLTAVVSDVWIANSGLLTNAETYVGNGTVWTKIKEAS